MWVRLRRTLLYCDGANIANVVINADELGSLHNPESVFLLIRDVAKELQPPSEELALIRIIQSTSAFARVLLIRVVDGERLVGDIGHGAYVAVAGVENLVYFSERSSIGPFGVENRRLTFAAVVLV